MSALQVPIRLDRIQQGLFEVFEEAIDPAQVVWAYGEDIFEARTIDFVSLTMSGGPQISGRRLKRGELLIPATSITLTVSGVITGSRYLLRLNGFEYFTDAIGGDTVSTIRDRLVTAINADSGETVTATAGGAGVLTLTADFTGGMRSLQIVGAITFSPPVLSSQAVLVTEGTDRMTINLQAFSKNREIRNGAWSLVSRCIAALQTESFSEKLRRFGVAVWNIGVVADISAIAGAHWESRVSLDFDIAARAEWVESADYFNTTTVSINTFAVDGTALASVTTTIP